MEQRLPQLAADGALAVVTGDLNVGHTPFDIKNWEGQRQEVGLSRTGACVLRPLLHESRRAGRWSGGDRARIQRAAERHPLVLRGCRRARLDRPRPPVRRRGRGPVHMVVEPRSGIRERHRMAHRLPHGHPRARGAGQRLPRRPLPVVRSPLERPRPRGRRVPPGLTRRARERTSCARVAPLCAYARGTFGTEGTLGEFIRRWRPRRGRARPPDDR